MHHVLTKKIFEFGATHFILVTKSWQIFKFATNTVFIIIFEMKGPVKGGAGQISQQPTVTTGA